MNTTTGPWNISETAFPVDRPLPEQWEFLLGYAILAPSSHNTQPWLFRVRGETVELYADRTRSLTVCDATDRELTISCGAALFHLRCALRHFGRLGNVELLPEAATDPDLLARVRLGTEGETSPEEALLFHAITKRRTNRQPFSTDPLPPALLSLLQAHAHAEGAGLYFVLGEEPRHAVAELVARGDRAQWGNPRFRRELAAWVHNNHSTARDGIPGYAQGLDDLMSCAGPLVVRTFDLGEGTAAKDQEIARHSPGLAVLHTPGDTPHDWLQAGQALAQVLLRARVEDVWASFLNQPVELADLREELTRSLGLPGRPQLILRLGFGPEVRPTPRRTVDEVLV